MEMGFIPLGLRTYPGGYIASILRLFPRDSVVRERLIVLCWFLPRDAQPLHRLHPQWGGGHPSPQPTPLSIRPLEPSPPALFSQFALWLTGTLHNKGEGLCHPSQRNVFLHFQVKNAGLFAFYCEKLLVARNWDRGALLTPCGAEDVKCTEEGNLAVRVQHFSAWSEKVLV